MHNSPFQVTIKMHCMNEKPVVLRERFKACPCLNVINAFGNMNVYTDRMFLREFGCGCECFVAASKGRVYSNHASAACR